MVRQKMHIVTDSRVRLNEVYPVRWGENDDTCDAIVLAAGDYIAMSAKADAARKDERFVLASTSDETVVPSNPPEDAQSYCSEPCPFPPPPMRRRVRPAPTTPKVSRVTPVKPRGTRSKTIRTLTKSGKPAARVNKVVAPPDFHESPLPTIRRPKPAKQRKRVQSTPPAPQQPPTSPLHLEQPSQQPQPDLPSLPTSLGQSTQQWCLYRGPSIPWTGSLLVLRRVTDLELQQQRLETKVDQLLYRQPQAAPFDQI